MPAPSNGHVPAPHGRPRGLCLGHDSQVANIYFPALNPIAQDLGVLVNLINPGVTPYIVFQAIAPALVGDSGNMAGRRPAFIICFAIYILANLSLALQSAMPPSWSSGWSSALEAATLSLWFAVVADVAVSALVLVVGSPARWGLFVKRPGWQEAARAQGEQQGGCGRPRSGGCGGMFSAQAQDRTLGGMDRLLSRLRWVTVSRGFLLVHNA